MGKDKTPHAAYAVAREVGAEIIQERMRQRGQEGYTDEHDNREVDGQLALAAACYAVEAACRVSGNDAHGVTYPFAGKPRDSWPWTDNDGLPEHDGRDKHPTRRCLVIAAALLMAEIERIDRDAAFKGRDPKTGEPTA